MFPQPVPALRALKAYDPGHDLPALRLKYGDALVELGSNENSLGPSEKARAAMQTALADAWRYPDPNAWALRRAIAARFDHPLPGVVLGNGSHELLIQLAQCHAGPGDEVLFSQYGFAVFPIAAMAVGATPVAAPALAVDDPMPRGHDAITLAAHYGPRTRLVYLANPNNPTGTWLSLAAVESLLARAKGQALVVVDEAYQEYVTEGGPRSAVSLLPEHPHLVVTRTFSKVHGLAGLRVGYALCHPQVAASLERYRETFNVNHVAQVAALAALDDEDHVERTRLHNANAREAMRTALQGMGLHVAPSQGNFVLIDFGRDAAGVEDALMQRAVVVRPMGGYGLPTCLRVTVGKEDENARFLAAMREVLACG
ncbi:MAG TPA: histidinol-phosphate transaminase [Xanthomonadaceae bacterium]|nr:histidinol-phosphate transaminase [Xanthomonadaceae bacterium]